MMESLLYDDVTHCISIKVNIYLID